MPVSRQTGAEHDKPIFSVQKIIAGVGFRANASFVMANLAFTTVTKQTGDFSNVHNFVKNFIWEPVQSTYCSKSRGVSLTTKKVRK
jgi:hypothetical protein